MSLTGLDWSSRGWARVFALTALGTIACICFAFAFDSYSFETDSWRWGTDPTNDLLIPLIIAPPFFYFLLSKLRELAIAHGELVTVASTDALTSLLNRRAFTAMVDGYLERVADGSVNSQGALLVVDVDYFKAINDRFGHERGDEALKLIAQTIRSAVRSIDLVGRIGGEEFCIFIPGPEPGRAAAVAERIRSAVNEATFVVADQPHPVSVSVGGATFAEPVDFSSLYRCADQWLYVAKERGRNRVEVRSVGSSRTEPNQAVHSLH
jgi:diguanylate cyclase